MVSIVPLKKCKKLRQPIRPLRKSEWYTVYKKKWKGKISFLVVRPGSIKFPNLIQKINHCSITDSGAELLNDSNFRSVVDWT